MSVNTFSPVRNLVVHPAMVVRPGNLNVFLGRKKKTAHLIDILLKWKTGGF